MACKLHATEACGASATRDGQNVPAAEPPEVRFATERGVLLYRARGYRWQPTGAVPTKTSSYQMRPRFAS
jgi:hypothetical protein